MPINRMEGATMDRYVITTSGVYNHQLGEWVKESEADAVIARLEAELQHQKELYAAHIGDEHDNCGMAINKRLVEAIKSYQNKSIELLNCNSEENLAIAKKEFETSASDLSEAIAAAEGK